MRLNNGVWADQDILLELVIGELFVEPLAVRSGRRGSWAASKPRSCRTRSPVVERTSAD